MRFEEDSECAACAENLGYVKNASKANASKAKEKRPARPAHVKVPVSKTNTEKTKETREG